MAVSLRFNRKGCSLPFEDANRNAIQRCLSNYKQIKNGHGQTVVITEAIVMNELHSSQSYWDQTKSDHATIQLRNDVLNSQGLWYTMHWRPSPDGRRDSPDTFVLPWTNREAPAKKRRLKLIEHAQK